MAQWAAIVKLKHFANLLSDKGTATTTAVPKEIKFQKYDMWIFLLLEYRRRNYLMMQMAFHSTLNHPYQMDFYRFM